MTHWRISEKWVPKVKVGNRESLRQKDSEYKLWKKDVSFMIYPPMSEDALFGFFYDEDLLKVAWKIIILKGWE